MRLEKMSPPFYSLFFHNVSLWDKVFLGLHPPTLQLCGLTAMLDWHQSPTHLLQAPPYFYRSPISSEQRKKKNWLCRGPFTFYFIFCFSFAFHVFSSCCSLICLKTEGWVKGCSFVCSLSPLCWMPLNPTQWSFNVTALMSDDVTSSNKW